MPFESHAGIGGRHALAVVDDLYEVAARFPEENLNLRGAGIDRVLEEFLDDRSRSLDYLARGYLVGHRIGQ